ncbi:MAG: lipopolysaccharide biosynthesis protein [Nannocystales bacterium]
MAQALAQAGLLVLAARFGSAQMVGDLALAMALCSPIMVIVGLQQRIVYVTDVKRRFGWSTHLRLRRWASASGVALVGLATAATWVPVSVGIALAIAVDKAGELAGDLHHATFQARGAMRLYAQSLGLRSVLGLTALGGTLALTGNLALGLFAMAAMAWGVATLYDAPRSAPLRSQTGPGSLAGLLAVSAPLGLVTFVDSITQHAVRIQVDTMLGTEALGHYAVMSYGATAGGAVVFSLGTPVLRRMAGQFAAGHRTAFARTTARLVGLSATLGAAGVLFALVVGEPFLATVFGDEFSREAPVFPWVMGAGAIQFVLGALMHAINAAQRRRAQPWIYLAALGTALIVGWIRIPTQGLLGASEAAAAGWTVAMGLAAVVLHRAWRSLPRPGHSP